MIEYREESNIIKCSRCERKAHIVLRKLELNGGGIQHISSTCAERLQDFSS